MNITLTVGQIADLYKFASPYLDEEDGKEGAGAQEEAPAGPPA